MRGETSLSDVMVVRELDKSSVKLWEYCAKGEPIKEVLIDLCVTVKDKQEPFLKYKLENVLISSYSASAAGSSNPVPTESVAFNFTKIEKNFVTVNKDTGVASGNVVAKYSPGEGKSG
jgi:type VI secretion system secreted protein Hcp